MTDLINTSDLNDWLSNPDRTHLKHKYDGTAAPGVTNDVDEGYSVGSMWFDVTNDKAYVCTDITDGAAVWTEITAGASGGDAWSDPVDAVITPDADGTRDLATTGTRFATGYFDNLDVTTNIVVGGTVDGRDLAADGAVIDGLGTLSTENKITSLAGANYTTFRDVNKLMHSVGVTVSGDLITDGGSGTIDIAEVNGFIRATDSQTADLVAFTVAASSGVALTSNSLNYVYVEYNSGSPQIAVTTTKRTDLNTNVYLGSVYRYTTELHITNGVGQYVGDHGALMSQRMIGTNQPARESGAVLSGSGTRNIAVTTGVFWSGLKQVTTASIDTSVSGTFRYFYRDGAGGFTEVQSVTQINNTQYDDGSGTLATLTNGRYGVHWVYLGADGDYYVLYGRGNYTLGQAESAQAPSTVPPHFEGHVIIIGKIIIQKDASSFETVQSAFNTIFSPSLVEDHGALSGLTDDDHTQYLLADGTRTLSGNLTITGTVDGRDIAVDGTKLDTIATNADVTDATNVAAAGAVMDSDFSTNGTMIRTGSGTYTNRTITGTTDEIDVANGDGVSGNPTIGLSDDPIVPGTGRLRIPVGTTAQRPGTPADGDLRVNTTSGTTEIYRSAAWRDLEAGGGGGIAWSDPVDADIIPDADGTRDLGATATRFAETYTDALFVTNNITVGGTVGGRNLTTDGTKLDGIEALADVTDAANVAAAGAVMDSDFSAGEGFMRKTGSGTYEAIKSNLSASVDPTTTDDTNSGYSVGSRWINTTDDIEFVCLDATASAAVWKETTLIEYEVEFLVIGGGGGGAGAGLDGGGGGAGGYRCSVSGESSGGGGSAEGTLTVQKNAVYGAVVGAGGAAGSNGVDSSFGSITSVGGGAGGQGTNSGSDGGSGGGGGGDGSSTDHSGGSGTGNQGYAGGAGNDDGGGGGGAGAAGTDGNFASGLAGDGGNGVSSSINGTATTRGGGGGGGGEDGGTGGTGGGGDGGAGTTGTAGTANTGGGGGGGDNGAGAAGGSGLVIIRYLGAQRGTGGTVTSSGGYTIHTFTSSSTYTA